MNLTRVADLRNTALQNLPEYLKRKLAGETVKRSRHTIISQILEICIDGASKTRIVYQANLNFRTVNPYINILINNDLVRIKPGQTVLYETTERGRELLENFKAIHRELIEL